jgi:hypothetical protein
VVSYKERESKITPTEQKQSSRKGKNQKIRRKQAAPDSLFLRKIHITTKNSNLFTVQYGFVTAYGPKQL